MKVFISSTLDDLKEYRDAVGVALGRLQLTYTTLDDLLANGGATSQLADRVLEEVRYADVFLLILGHRYGSTLQGSDVGWVEAEFKAAQRLKKPLLAFLADSQAPFPPASVDEDRTRIERFREMVRAQYAIKEFRSPGELSMEVASALAHFIHRPVHPTAAGKQSSHRRTIRIVRLLLSSPGDVPEEREAVSRVVSRYNQQEVESSGTFLKLVRWEDMAPQVGPGPQQVINEQIGAYDLFVGVMWNRFGTPTDVAASGTEEEFRAAVELWRATGSPWITFYFCDRPVNFTHQQQLEQKARVLAFQAELGTLGVVRRYTTIDMFENALFQDLLRIVPRLEPKD